MQDGFKQWLNQAEKQNKIQKKLSNVKDLPVNVLSYDLSEIIVPSFDYLFDPIYYSVREMLIFGSRKSAKTKHVALRMIYRMLTDKNYNGLAMRKVASELRHSVQVELQWAINTLGANGLFRINLSAREFIYTPTNQKILMKGISINPSSGMPSLSGLNVETGNIKDVWLEEAWEFTYADYKMIRQTLRGGIYTSILIGNPYFESIWAVRKAVDLLKPNLDVLKELGQQWEYFEANKGRMETIIHWNNFQINTKLHEADIEERWVEEQENPKDFITTGYGFPGSPSGTILGDLTHKIRYISLQEFRINSEYFEGGVDVGLTNDATAAVFGSMLYDGSDAYAGEYYHSNGEKECNKFSDNGVWRKKDPDELAIDVIEFFLMYKPIWSAKGKLKVAVDSADRAFIKILNNKALVLGESEAIKFVPTIGEDEGKKEIETRIIEWRQELAHRKIAFVEDDGIMTMTQLLYEMDNLPWKINMSNGKATRERDDSKVPDHITNAAEYKKRKNTPKRLRKLGI